MSSSDYVPNDRRPIASRNTRWAERVAKRLAARGASPNGISIFGMTAAVAAGALLYATPHAEPLVQRALWIGAALFIQVRLLCNLFDGMVAVATGKASPVGELYNEVPDRVSDAVVLIGVGYAVGGHVILGFAAACAAIFVAYVRAMGTVAGGGSHFSGPMAKPQRMFLVTVSALYMALAPASWTSWGSVGVPTIALAVVAVGCAVTALRRLASATSALREAA